MVNYRAVIHILSALLIFLGLCLVFPALFALYYREPDLQAFAITIAISLVSGTIFFFASGSKRELHAKDGFLIVSAGWLLFAIIGALPFKLSGFIPSYTDAFFETMSGFTTTGASILTNIEALPHGLLFWRSLTHWLGGMGIIVFSLAILPLLGVGGMQLFKAEVPGPTPDKLTPRIASTAKLLWGVYALISLAETIALRLAGMTWFDALCHTFGTMATGGFSTKNTSIGYYDSAAIDYIIVVFMILAGINFALHYRALRGKPGVYVKDHEARAFIGLIAIAFVLIGVDVWKVTGHHFAKTIQYTLFQVVSILTTTGYGTADYEQWSHLSQVILFFLMFFGGCAGSTGGGIKIIRTMILIKMGITEIKRQIHPKAVFSVRIGDAVIPPEIAGNIAGFFLLHVALTVVGILFMSALGLDLPSAFGSVAANINNIGPGLGSVGPTDNYAQIPAIGKWFLSFLMLVGRLELFTVIILFTFSYWKK
ncbi:MAG: TrkH family potassium uptake protein [candidate division KSB1 bacterium]|jgi:trk system potassium uptake protein TrkH|nr:TrkH family potassium uptake protein [candidate division KSB1 bacterium]